MKCAEIIALYACSESVKKICSWLGETQFGDLYLSGLVESSDSFVAAGVFKSNNFHHVFVLNDKESAAYFQNNLASLIENKDILYFPDSFKRPQQFDELNNNNILIRTESVNRLIHPNSKAELMVTYPEALIEKVVTAEKLNEQCLRLAIGENFDDDFAIDLLIEFDFERVDFVYDEKN